jgi:hypothetical protein
MNPLDDPEALRAIDEAAEIFEATSVEIRPWDDELERWWHERQRQEREAAPRAVPKQGRRRQR